MVSLKPPHRPPPAAGVLMSPVEPCKQELLRSNLAVYGGWEGSGPFLPGKEGPVRLCQGPAKRPHGFHLEKGGRKALGIWEGGVERNIASTTPERGEGPTGNGDLESKPRVD